MKIKKIVLSLIALLSLAALSFGIFQYYTMEDKNSTLTMSEKEWIEENKNTIFDLGIVNNIPVLNDNGTGVLFDFIESLEKNIGLEFNRISYLYGSDNSSKYSFIFKNNIDKNDILFYSDYYAILSNNKTKYNSLDEIPNLVIGVLKNDLKQISNNLSSNKKISYVEYSNIDDLINAINESKIDSLILPKTIYLKEILDNDLAINYVITEMKSNLVLTLGEDKKLNNILKKYSTKWLKESYELSYSKNFTDYYLDAMQITDSEKTKFLGKQYKYGFIQNAPYDKIVDGKLEGINKEILKTFSNISGVEIKYNPEYKDSKALVDAFNANDLDFYFNNLDNTEYKMDVYNTVSVFDEKISVLAKNTSKYIINSPESLRQYDVISLENTMLSSYLEEIGCKVKKYKNIVDIINNDSKAIIVIDKKTYEAYKINSLSSYNEIFEFSLDKNYNFVIRDIKENKIFINYLDFYLSFMSEKEISNSIDYRIYDIKSNNILSIIIFITVLILLIISIVFLIKKSNKKVKNKSLSNISKEDKIKYVDMLTSLKNRNYLNDSIEKWDSSEIYPQAIVIIDLNNIAYINDNYGHKEGDNVITEAANILIKNQIANSEIIRTNGNEFLLYLVEYDEKQVLTHIKKLTKEFKELSHGFGAAIGYSMITDGLKTVDDAINEATLDMKANKEEAKN